jgi:hypothetical protein
MRSPLIVLFALASVSGCSSDKQSPRLGTNESKLESTATFLQKIVGQDLREPDSTDRRSLEDLLPEAYRDGACFPYVQGTVWQTKDSRGRTSFALFQAWESHSSDEGSSAALHLFDQSGERVSSTSFPTGSRLKIQRARLSSEPLADGEVIELTTGKTPPPRPVRTFYGFHNSRLIFLRAEDSNGDAIQNTYSPRFHQIGPKVVKRTLEEWDDTLRSGHMMELLEALMWLGGKHRSPHPWKCESQSYEELEIAEQVDRLQKSTTVRKRVIELTRSENRWVREAASLAGRELQPPYHNQGRGENSGGRLPGFQSPRP